MDLIPRREVLGEKSAKDVSLRKDLIVPEVQGKYNTPPEAFLLCPVGQAGSILERGCRPWRPIFTAELSAWISTSE